MSLVVDASVAIKWLIDEDGSGRAEAVLARGPLIAPELIFAEVPNVLWRHVQTGALTPQQAEEAALVLRDTFDAIYPMEPLTRRALAMAVELGHPVYDCIYLALAESAACPLVTADKRLATKVAGTALAGLVEVL